jgi:hypothetical protein
MPETKLTKTEAGELAAPRAGSRQTPPPAARSGVVPASLEQ